MIKKIFFITRTIFNKMFHRSLLRVLINKLKRSVFILHCENIFFLIIILKEQIKNLKNIK